MAPDEEGSAQQLDLPGNHINRSNKLVIEAKQEKRSLASPETPTPSHSTFARGCAGGAETATARANR